MSRTRLSASLEPPAATTSVKAVLRGPAAYVATTYGADRE